MPVFIGGGADRRQSASVATSARSTNQARPRLKRIRWRAERGSAINSWRSLLMIAIAAWFAGFCAWPQQASPAFAIPARTGSGRSL